MGTFSWILGCSSGIGEKLAYQLAQLHCKLILSATNAEKLKEVKLKCIGKSIYLCNCYLLLKHSKN